MGVKLVGVKIFGDNSDKIYDFKNDCDFDIKKNDIVTFKVGNGGTKDGKVMYIKEVEKLSNDIKYKKIVEVKNLKTDIKPLLENNIYICDVRIWRNQWSSGGGYKEQWSDMSTQCLYDINIPIKIGDIGYYQDSKAKIVNLRQIPEKKAKNLKYITIKNDANNENKGLVSTLLNKIFGIKK